MMHGALRACLKVAVEQKALPLNPAVGIRLPRHNRREMRFFTQAEALKFVAVAEAGLDRVLTGEPQSPEAGGVYTLFIVMLMSGLRVGEVLALRWADLDGSTLRVRRAVTQDAQRRKVIGPTKTSRSRAVPIGDRALKALQRHRVAQAKWKLLTGEHYRDQGLIFASATGGIMQAENLPHRLFRQLLKAAGLPAIRLYDLRHSHATLLMAAGEHPKVVQERLGHSSIQLTLDTYSHVVPGMQERATERLEAMFTTPAANTAVKA
jgi:integrase